ncbi:MAG: TolC family protein [Candidatus Margulisiibacteriota bacterium]
MKKLCSILALVLFLAPCQAAPLTLEKCLEIAGKYNPQIITAKEKIGIASAKMGQAGSALLPQITGNLSSGKNFTKPMTVTLPPSMGGGTFSTTPNEPSDVMSYSGTVSQLLFSGGQIMQAVSAAKVGYDISLQEYKKTKNDVEYNVISSYFDVLKAKKTVSIVEETKNYLARYVRQTELFNRSGLASSADVLRARAELANSMVSKISAQTGLEAAKLVLAANLGTDQGSDFDVAELEGPYYRDRELTSKEILDSAFKNRPEWLSFKMGLKVASDAIIYSYGSYLPVVMYQYSAGMNSTKYKQAGLNFDLDNWRSMIVASWSPFDGFRTANVIREAYAALNTAKAQEQTLKDVITLEVKTSLLTLTGNRERVKAAEIARDLAKKALRLSELGYKANTTSNLSYLEALLANFRAENSLWNSIYDLEISKARVNKTTGERFF